jgi:predicted dehydrogenase
MKGVSIVAVADPDERSRTALANGSAAAHADARSLIADGSVDAVLISVPTALHFGVAKMAAESGKAFYLEKPIAVTAAEARELCALVESCGAVAAVGFNRRAHPLFSRARELIASGAVGEVHAVQTIFSEPTPKDGIPEWKSARSTGGGVLLDLASHHIDLIRWLLSEEIREVTATTASQETEDDRATVSMLLTSGARAQSFFSLRSAYADFIEITGERATIRIDRHSASLTMSVPRRIGYGSRRVEVQMKEGIASRIRKLARPAEDPSYYRSLEAFVQQVEGKRVPLASMADGESSLAVVLAAEESARSGSTVRIGSR